MTLPRLFYNRIVGLPQPPRQVQGRQGLLLPVEDFHAYRALQRRGELTYWRWLKEIAHPTIFRPFAGPTRDPTLVFEAKRIRNGVGRRLRRWLRLSWPCMEEAPPPTIGSVALMNQS